LAIAMGSGLVMAACGSRSPPSAPPANAAPANPSTVDDLAKLDPALPDLVARADAIVEGTATITATRDGHLGRIAVAAVLAGTAPEQVTFISAPYDLPAEGVYFLAQDASTQGSYRLLDDAGRRLGMPRDWADEIGAATLPPSAAVVDESTRRLASDIQTFRAASGQPWSPSQSPAVDAARTIFAELPVAGRPVDDIVAALGEPDVRNPDGSIEYVRHMGEAGVIRRLRVRDGRVSAVEIHQTE
jgi:hypothetical protein